MEKPAWKARERGREKGHHARGAKEKEKEAPAASPLITLFCPLICARSIPLLSIPFLAKATQANIGVNVFLRVKVFRFAEKSINL